MTSRKNLWGNLPDPETIRTPYTILKEQASILTEITKGLLIGEVSINNQKDNVFTAILRIKAPSLNNYTYSVIQIEQPIHLYPVTIANLFENRVGHRMARYSSEEEFENALGQILSSQDIQRIISGLLAQIHSDIPK